MFDGQIGFYIQYDTDDDGRHIPARILWNDGAPVKDGPPDEVKAYLIRQALPALRAKAYTARCDVTFLERELDALARGDDD